MCVHIENPLFSELRIAQSVLRKGRRDSHVSIALSARKSRFQAGIHIRRSFSQSLAQAPGSSRVMTARIFAIANQKGGVGKTTTAVNLCAYLARAGRRVLLVDSDPQANATTSLGIDPRASRASLYEILIDSTPLQDAIMPTAHPGLELVPANLDLAGAEVENRRTNGSRTAAIQSVAAHPLRI